MAGSATMRHTMGQYFYLLVWLLTSLLLAIVLQFVSAETALGDGFGEAPATVASDFPIQGADPADEPLPSVRYRGLMWSLVGAEVEPAPGLLDATVVDVELEVRNTLSATTLRAADSLVWLAADGSEDGVPARFRDAGTRLTLEPGERQRVVATFSLGRDAGTDPDDLSIEIGEPGRRPARLSLSATASPDVDYPIRLAVDDESIVVDDPDEPARQIVLTVDAAAVDVDAGGYRALVDEHLVTVRVDVQRAAELDDPGFVQSDFWLLDADGEITAPIIVLWGDQPSGNTDEIVLLFSLPAEADDLTLVADPDGPAPARFPLVQPR